MDFRIVERTYKAIGFPNRTGGFELRNQWFKGSSTPKDISLITSENNSSKLSVFEGFIDFLSALTIRNPKFLETTKDSSFLVLNSVAFIGREIPLLRSFPEVSLFLDNDNAGKEAKTRLHAQGIPFKDASTWYSKHKDVNEFLLADALAKKQESVKTQAEKQAGR
ncbi:MAG: toprim domain-containing protein [Flammeovirgaceae bacterium]|nr:toprim domain-containing protein [Flammeovirgaceae bacterium]